LIETTIAKRYAKGLYKAIEKNNYSKIEKQLKAFSKLLSTNIELKNFFENPMYTRKEKSALIKKILSNLDFIDLINRFFILLAENNRMNLLPEIIDEIKKIYFKDNNVFPLDVYTPMKLDKEEKEKIINTFRKKLKGKIKAEFYVDKKVIGGILVKYKSTYYDGSIMGFLNKIKDNILKEKRDENQS